MNAKQVQRNDFPAAADGYDRASVDAHLAAVAAQLNALEVRIASFEVEREALRRQIADFPTPTPAPAVEPEPESAPTPVTVETEADSEVAQSSSSAEDEVSARLIATKMALDGTDRETIRLHLADSYDLEELDTLLDDVIERVG